MPIFHKDFVSRGNPDPDYLRKAGPSLPVEIAIPDVLAAVLANQSLPIPSPISGFALFDTGASITGVDETVLTQLSLSPIGVTNISTPSAGQAQCSQYPAKILFPTTPLPPLTFTSVVGITLRNQGYVALIGRDIMAAMLIVYDGPGARVTFGF